MALDLGFPYLVLTLLGLYGPSGKLVMVALGLIRFHVGAGGWVVPWPYFAWFVLGDGAVFVGAVSHGSLLVLCLIGPRSLSLFVSLLTRPWVCCCPAGYLWCLMVCACSSVLASM